MKLEMVGISIYGSLCGVARFPVSYVIELVNMQVDDSRRLLLN